jgi:site-specific DNA-methyltransferase (adenine-specific)
MQYQIFNLDCRDVMSLYLEDNSVDAIVTDPPYGLSFMGKDWDHGVPGIEFWKKMLRVLKPGGHLLSFGGSRTYHRMASAVEDAGFEIRDQIMWVYGSGFPKSLDVSKALDNASGAEREVIGVAGKSGITRSCMAGNFTGGEYMKTAPATDAARQWQGWGTALKPAHEPLVLARKPLIGTVAANVLAHGTGGLNIDGCRVGWPGGKVPEIGTPEWGGPAKKLTAAPGQEGETVERTGPDQLGRWPANLIHDGSDEVVSCFPDAKGQQGDIIGHSKERGNRVYGKFPPALDAIKRVETETTAARFFYAAKASKKDRDDGNAHPTVKPTDLMAYLCRLVTPAGGVVLDPFMGSGSTGKAAIKEGFRFIGVEREAAYYAIAEARLKAAAV